VSCLGVLSVLVCLGVPCLRRMRCSRGVARAAATPASPCPMPSNIYACLCANVKTTLIASPESSLSPPTPLSLSTRALSFCTGFVDAADTLLGYRALTRHCAVMRSHGIAGLQNWRQRASLPAASQRAGFDDLTRYLLPSSPASNTDTFRRVSLRCCCSCLPARFVHAA